MKQVTVIKSINYNSCIGAFCMLFSKEVIVQGLHKFQ